MHILEETRNSNESSKLWPRQKSPDTTTWIMWKSIIRKIFCSYDNHLQSNFRLGSWTYLPSQLSRKYSFLYSPALKEIYQVKGKEIFNSFVNKKGRLTIIRNVDSQNTTQLVPVDAHPIKFLSGNSFYIMCSPEFTPTNNKPKSLI